MMKETPILLSMLSASRPDPGEEPQSIRTMTSGTLTEENGGYTIRYRETLQDDTGGTVSRDVTLFVSPHRAMMESVGPYGMTMVFQRGLHYDGIYHTPFGDMPISLQTTRMSVVMDPRLGSLKVTYQLDTQGSYATMMDIELHWRARAGAV